MGPRWEKISDRNVNGMSDDTHDPWLMNGVPLLLLAGPKLAWYDCGYPSGPLTDYIQIGKSKQ